MNGQRKRARDLATNGAVAEVLAVTRVEPVHVQGDERIVEPDRDREPLDDRHADARTDGYTTSVGLRVLEELVEKRDDRAAPGRVVVEAESRVGLRERDPGSISRPRTVVSISMPAVSRSNGSNFAYLKRAPMLKSSNCAPMAAPYSGPETTTCGERLPPTSSSRLNVRNFVALNFAGPTVPSIHSMPLTTLQ